MPTKLVIVIDGAEGMDSSCTHDILQACVNHGGTVIEAYFVDAAEPVMTNGQTHDIRHELADIVPEQGKC